MNVKHHFRVLSLPSVCLSVFRSISSEILPFVLWFVHKREESSLQLPTIILLAPPLYTGIESPGTNVRIQGCRSHFLLRRNSSLHRIRQAARIKKALRGRAIRKCPIRYTGLLGEHFAAESLDQCFACSLLRQWSPSQCCKNVGCPHMIPTWHMCWMVFATSLSKPMTKWVFSYWKKNHASNIPMCVYWIQWLCYGGPWCFCGRPCRPRRIWSGADKLMIKTARTHIYMKTYIPT
jgi:hypothetical protein